MKLLDISLPLSYAVLASVSLLTTLSGCTLRAQELSPLLAASSKIEGPKPKILKPRPNARSRFALDRTSLALGLFQAGAELFDGIGTHRYVNAPSCRSCIEGDPVCRFFLGRRPTWPRMVTLGTLEVFGAAYLQQGMRRSPHKLLRWLAPATSLALTTIHIDQGVGVFAASTNPCSPLGPGYSVMSQSPTGDHVACTRSNVLLPVVQRTRPRH
jgi:hypothetical protein